MDDVLLSPLSGTDDDWELLDPHYEAPPRTPSTASDETPARPGTRDLSDGGSDDDAGSLTHSELIPRRKPGGYDSRVEQMLYENPELPILIIDAGKSSESGGRYIVYTIKTGVRSLTAHHRNHRLANISPLPRTSLFGGDIRNLRRFATPLPDSIPLS